LRIKGKEIEKRCDR